MGYEVTEKSTVHGTGTPHGFQTPHRFPVDPNVDLSFIMSDLANRLYPTGRAFNMPKGGVMDSFHSAVNVSFIRVLNDSMSTINSVLPDNNDFNEDDCSLWEYRYGLVTNQTIDIVERRKAIFRKMSRGRNVKARQHKNYIEYQLREAGFDVYVHENGFIEMGVKVYKTPEEITLTSPLDIQHGGVLQHGLGAQHGSAGSAVIANSAEPNESYSVGGNLWATFFIGGATLGDVADVPANREYEFRELVLKLKPAHLVAFTFLNFV